jgi:hypothetical protein
MVLLTLQVETRGAGYAKSQDYASAHGRYCVYSRSPSGHIDLAFMFTSRLNFIKPPHPIYQDLHTASPLRALAVERLFLASLWLTTTAMEGLSRRLIW